MLVLSFACQAVPLSPVVLLSLPSFHASFPLPSLLPLQPLRCPSPSSVFDDAYFGCSEGSAIESEAFLRHHGNRVVLLFRRRKLEERLVEIGIEFVASSGIHARQTVLAEHF